MVIASLLRRDTDAIKTNDDETMGYAYRLSNPNSDFT